jgi:hypothetical protein
MGALDALHKAESDYDESTSPRKSLVRTVVIPLERSTWHKSTDDTVNRACPPPVTNSLRLVRPSHALKE